MKRMLLLFPVVALAACAAKPKTEVVSVWQDEETKRLECTETVVLFASDNEALRKMVEDRVSQKVRGGRPAYALGLSKDRGAEELKTILREGGYDCGIVMKFAAEGTDAGYVEGEKFVVPEGSAKFYADYDQAWGTYYEPGDIDEERTAVLDVHVHDIKNEKMVWRTRTHTVDPAGPEDAIANLVDAVGDEMRKDGLID
jgi:hypothetical protein